MKVLRHEGYHDIAIVLVPSWVLLEDETYATPCPIVTDAVIH